MRTLNSFIIYFSILFFHFQSSHAQVTINNAYLANYGSAKIQIHGDVHLTSNAFIYNESEILISGDFINDSGDDGFVDIASGKVIYFGDNQIIGGNDETYFNHLEFAGTGVKTLANNVYVRQTLNLNDREVHTEENTLFVMNIDANSVFSNEGFVSSSGAGRLSRNMESSEEYFFPVGSAEVTERKRPLTITPSTNDQVTFAVRMVNNNPSLDGYDIQLKNDSVIEQINPEWYHLINQTEGNQSVQITFYFDETADDAYDMITQWQNVDGWQETGTITLVSNTSPLLSKITLDNWNDFTHEPFALAIQPDDDEVINYITEGKEFTFSIYPNPVSEQLIIQNKGKLFHSKAKIYDAKGNLVYTATLNEVTNVIDIRNFSKGVYLLHIENDEFLSSERIVVQ